MDKFSIYLRAEGNLGKLKLGDHLMRTVQPVTSNGATYHQMPLIGSHSMSKEGKEGNLEKIYR